MTAGKSSSPEKVLQLIADMRVKLKAMHKVVRREMAAVRQPDRCCGARHDWCNSSSFKLISVLERVLPKWEKRERPAFLFRSIRYLDLMTMYQTYGKS